MNGSANRATWLSASGVREVVLREVARARKTGVENVLLLGEITGLRLLLINTLEPPSSRRQDDAGAVQRNAPVQKSTSAKRRRTRLPATQKGPRNSHDRHEMGPQRDHRSPASLSCVQLRSGFRLAVATPLCLYLNFAFVMSPLQRYFVPCYLETGFLGTMRRSSDYQLVTVSDRHTMPYLSLKPMCSQAPRFSRQASRSRWRFHQAAPAIRPCFPVSDGER